MTHYIEISSLKGGVGKTTLAGLVALALNEQDHKVMLIGTNGDDQLHALMGTTSLAASWQNIEIIGVDMAGKSQFHSYDFFDYVVVDADNRMFDYPDGSVVTRIGAVRNDYMTLRTMVNYTPDFFVALTIASNVLNMRDVKSVLKRPVVEIPTDEYIARAIDAGLFVSRWQEKCKGVADEILGMLTVSV